MKKKNKMPAILFYTGDWLKDPATRCLTLEARGLWIDMLCLMYESPKRGHLSLASGDAVTEVQLSRMVGSTLPVIKRLLREMEACGVFDKENGVIINRRMVRDEIDREKKSRAGRQGMESRYNKKDNTPTTPVEYEYETDTVIETTNSSNNYLLSRRSRQNNPPIDLVLDAIPKNRLQNPSKTRVQIRRVLDVAVSNGKNEMDCATLLSERFVLYYESEEGQGQYFKSPHKWLEDDCHLVDPSVWGSRKKEPEESGWDSVRKD